MKFQLRRNIERERIRKKQATTIKQKRGVNSALRFGITYIRQNASARYTTWKYLLHI